MAEESAECFHCGLPVPPGSRFEVVIDGAPRAMCCAGCQAVAQAIVDNGLDEFYRHRDQPATQPRELVPDALRELDLYDQPALQQSFVKAAEGEVREAALILEGITCAACVWLNERHVGALEGVLDFNVNYSTHRARVRWDDARIHLSDILKAIATIGYIAHPYDPGRQDQLFRKERGVALRRLAVSALMAMQVMMLAVAMYAGDAGGMSPGIRDFLRWVSLFLTLPVVFYAAVPFFQGAWRDLRRRRVGMDVPVALAIGGAFVVSAWDTLRGHGDIYFDSVAMFVFFMLTSRYLEMNARHKAGRAAEELVKLLPVTAVRVDAEGRQEAVTVSELRPGDRVLVKPGETLPADGVIEEGESAVDESLLSGESLPLPRKPGERVVGGSVNVDGPLLVRVEQVGEDTTLSAIVRLLDRAQAEKPSLAGLADRVAGWFVLGLLVLAALTALWWAFHEPARAFVVTLSVLVVSCPCALSLATPAAVTAATGRLLRGGVLVTRGHALETLARVDRVLFDKTGTLTLGRLSVARVEPLRDGFDESEALDRAAALEARSEHPLARALIDAAPAPERYHVSEARNLPGRGVEGVIDGRSLRLGRPDFVAAASGDSSPTLVDEANTAIALGDEQGLLAILYLADQPRDDAAETIAALRALGIEAEILSGDREATVAATARQLGGIAYHAEQSPQQKLAHLRALQARGLRVAMVGDGVNDAPVLAGADVSLAIGSGADVSQASADMVLMSTRLMALAEAVATARRTTTIIRQNLGWALVYNIVAIPVAAAGIVAPWMAALGMSFSSLIVVMNALRLR